MGPRDFFHVWNRLIFMSPDIWQKFCFSTKNILMILKKKWVKSVFFPWWNQVYKKDFVKIWEKLNEKKNSSDFWQKHFPHDTFVNSCVEPSKTFFFFRRKFSAWNNFFFFTQEIPTWFFFFFVALKNQWESSEKWNVLRVSILCGFWLTFITQFVFLLGFMWIHNC